VSAGKKPMRVMLDTNVVVSAALFRNAPLQQFLDALGQDSVVLADYVLDELREVFDRKFPDRRDDLERFLGEVGYELSEMPVVDADAPWLRDPDDVPVLQSAIASGVDILVTGDKDFAGVVLERPLVLTPAQYVLLRGQQP